MRNIVRILIIFLFSVVLTRMGLAREYQFGNYKSTKSIKSTAAGCGAPSGFRFLEVNNVRTRINTGGDMWWDLPGGIGSQYFVPANSSTTSMFSGSLWIGGLDINNQLKLAALRYRQDGQDYWTGPLTIDGTAAIDEETCSEWDKFFRMNRKDIDEFIQHTDPETGAYIGGNDYQIPKWMSKEEYPAHGDISKGQSYYMAPFKDADGDGAYNPESGDYPYYDVSNELCPLNYAGDPTYVPAPTMESELYENYFGGILVDQVLKGDETLWWVFNDKGNFHTETGGAAIGMEIRAQAFAFSTNDEINNMTFYSYEIINRSTYELTQTYFSPWADTDLGYAYNDYVGCDVERGLGYCYNGTPVDEGGPEAYGEQPPAVGVDFFQGPYMDPDSSDNPSYRGDGLLGPSYDGNCGIVNAHGTEVTLNYGYGDTMSGTFKVRREAINGVNFGNGIVDDERYGMRRFVYHNNGGANYMSDPSTAPEHYNFLRGIWKDNTQMMYGGNAHVSSGAAGPECEFMFPGDSDPCNWGTAGIPPGNGLNTEGNYWTEETVGNNPWDRRFMQSAGPFTLKPGAVNYITFGVPWARAVSGGPWASVKLLRTVDDKCQALFDNCFKVINGPDAPDLTFKELENELIVYITNSASSNNFVEGYKELDPLIKAQTPDSLVGTPLEYDPYYRFEGYQIFQLKDATVTLSESRYDLNKVRLVAQFDIKNGVSQIVNYKYDQSIGANIPVVEVIGGDNGIQHVFSLAEDAFAAEDKALINFRQYYYSAIAYGYNNFKEYDQTLPSQLDGQKKPYLAGRKNIQLYTGIPHKAINGIQPYTNFGEGPKITRIEGQGNGRLTLEFSDKTIEALLAKPPAGITADGDTIKYGDDNYPIVYNPEYKQNYGPVEIKVIDPLNVKKANYQLRFDTTFYHYTYTNLTGTEGLIPGGDTAGIKYAKRWRLYEVFDDKDPVFISNSEVGTNINYEQLFPELGFSVNFKPIFEPGLYKIGETINLTPFGVDTINVNTVLATNNGLIESSIEYADSSRQWLGGVQDFDITGQFRSYNWIRSGTSFNQTADDDWETQIKTHDPEEAYEAIAGGTWAPYYMCSTNAENQDENGAALNNISKSKSGGLKEIASVDIVLTPDKSKWTRSPIIEMCSDVILSEGGAEKFKLRKAPSVDKDGNKSGWPAQTDYSLDPNDPNYILSHGMGWFPGYAINLETGERLNIMFGEDSYLVGENGRDMLFNPTSNQISNPIGAILFGGKHYVYIMRSAEIHDSFGSNVQIDFSFPAYDAGFAIAHTIDTIPAGPLTNVYLPYIYSSTMYVGYPLSVPNVEWLSNDVKIKIRIAKPYDRYYAGTTDRESINNHYPMYGFSTDEISTSFYNEDKAIRDNELISVVPNPYYAFSTYENVPLDNRIKITNLPEKCVITIYNISGTLIRRFTKDDPVTFIDWDLKNHAGIPIAGGVYIIHVKDESTGVETIVKWFGSLRIEDFEQF